MNPKHQEIHFVERIGWLRAAVLGWVPGNQLFELNVSEFVVRLPRLPAATAAAAPVYTAR